MVQRRPLLAGITRARLVDLAAHFGIEGVSGKPKDAILQAISGARAVKTTHLLETLSRDELKALCRRLDLDDAGRAKRTLIERLTGTADGKPTASTKRFFWLLALGKRCQGPARGP